jgi:hypothetical protein
MEDLVVVYDRKAVGVGEDFDKVLFFAVQGGGEVPDHVCELAIGERRVVDDGAIGCERGISGRDL